MPKRITGVSQRLLACAKEEFLEKGFQNASIRSIAQKADTSPRAVYTRFPNKEGLFDAIVAPAASELIGLYQDFGQHFWSEYNIGTDIPSFPSDPNEIYIKMIDSIYDHGDEFKLMIGSLNGTRYQDLIEQLTRLNYRYLEASSQKRKTDIPNYEAMMKLLYMLTHSFYISLFEPLLNNMKLEEARFYVRNLCDFFTFGVQGLKLV